MSHDADTQSPKLPELTPSGPTPRTRRRDDGTEQLPPETQVLIRLERVETTLGRDPDQGLRGEINELKRDMREMKNEIVEMLSARGKIHEGCIRLVEKYLEVGGIKWTVGLLIVLAILLIGVPITLRGWGVSIEVPEAAEEILPDLP